MSDKDEIAVNTMLHTRRLTAASSKLGQAGFSADDINLIESELRRLRADLERHKEALREAQDCIDALLDVLSTSSFTNTEQYNKLKERCDAVRDFAG